METIKQQISRLIDKSNNVLVATPENINGDALGSALALQGALKKLGKNAQLIIPKELPTKFGFLPITNSLSYDILQEREFVLSIKNPKGHINNLYYENTEDLLHIYLKAKEKIEEKDLRIVNSHPFDLIFTINNRGFENLGKAFEYYPELFFDIPVINIDNHTANENYGEINLIDVASSSVSEIVMGLIDFLDRNLLDQEIATWILTGLIDATDNFQSSKTTPRTFNNAALLINRGGNQQEIIRYLYKTKSLDFLRLWGLVLHGLSWNEAKRLVLGKIKQEDFQKTNTSPEFIPQILEEIKTAFPEMQTTLILWQALPTGGQAADEKIKGTIYSLNLELLKNLHPKLGGILKDENLLLEIKSQSLEETEKQLLNLINGEL